MFIFIKHNKSFYKKIVSMTEERLSDDEEIVDVRSLPLKPPQPLLPPEKPVRRPWHPVMWNETTAKDSQSNSQKEQDVLQEHEYPHTKRIRNLRRLIAEVSDDRQKKYH